MCHDNEEWCKIWRASNLSLQNWHGQFDQFWPEHLKVSNTFVLMRSFWAKYILFKIKKYRRVIFHDAEEWYKIWWGINLLFQNWHEEFGKYWPEHSRVPKMLTLMGSFWTKYTLFELKKYTGVIFHGNEKWCKILRKTDLWFEKWHEKFGKFSPIQRSYMSWQWRMMQNLKRNWLVISKLTWGIWRILIRTLGNKKKMLLN